MRLVPPPDVDSTPDDSESIFVSHETLDTLTHLARALHCEMPAVIAVPALIHAILDRLVTAEADLSRAASEAELRHAAGEILLTLVGRQAER